MSAERRPRAAAGEPLAAGRAKRAAGQLGSLIWFVLVFGGACLLNALGAVLLLALVQELGGWTSLANLVEERGWLASSLSPGLRRFIVDPG